MFFTRPTIANFFVLSYLLHPKDVAVYRIGYQLKADILLVISATTPILKPIMLKTSPTTI